MSSHHHNTQVGREQRFQGVLWKRRDIFRKSWRPRWFVLQSGQGVLTYYLLTKDVASGSSSNLNNSIHTNNTTSTRNNATSATATAAAMTTVPQEIATAGDAATSATETAAIAITTTPTSLSAQTSGSSLNSPNNNNNSNNRERLPSYASASENSIDYDVVPRGAMYLLGCKVSINDKLSRPSEDLYAFTITPPTKDENPYHLAAKSNEQRTLWVEKLREACNHDPPPQQIIAASAPAAAAQQQSNQQQSNQQLQQHRAQASEVTAPLELDSAAVASNTNGVSAATGATNDTKPPAKKQATLLPAETTPPKLATCSSASSLVVLSPEQEEKIPWESSVEATASSSSLVYRNLPASLKQRIQYAIKTNLLLCDETAQDGKWSTLFLNNKDGVSAFQKQHNGTTLIKSTAVLPYHPNILFNLIINVNRRKEFETNIHTCKRLYSYNPHSFLDYYSYKAVWPTAPRDFAVMLHWQVLQLKGSNKKKNGAANKSVSQSTKDNNEKNGKNDTTEDEDTTSTKQEEEQQPERAIVLVAFSCSEADVAVTTASKTSSSSLLSPSSQKKNHVRGYLHVSFYLLRHVVQLNEKGDSKNMCHVTRLLSYDLKGSVPTNLTNTVLFQQANMPGVISKYLHSLEQLNQSRKQQSQQIKKEEEEEQEISVIPEETQEEEEEETESEAQDEQVEETKQGEQKDKEAATATTTTTTTTSSTSTKLVVSHDFIIQNIINVQLTQQEEQLQQLQPKIQQALRQQQEQQQLLDAKEQEDLILTPRRTIRQLSFEPSPPPIMLTNTATTRNPIERTHTAPVTSTEIETAAAAASAVPILELKEQQAKEQAESMEETKIREVETKQQDKHDKEETNVQQVKDVTKENTEEGGEIEPSLLLIAIVLLSPIIIYRMTVVMFRFTFLSSLFDPAWVFYVSVFLSIRYVVLLHLGKEILIVTKDANNNSHNNTTAVGIVTPELPPITVQMDISLDKLKKSLSHKEPSPTTTTDNVLMLHVLISALSKAMQKFDGVCCYRKVSIPCLFIQGYYKHDIHPAVDISVAAPENGTTFTLLRNAANQSIQNLAKDLCLSKTVNSNNDEDASSLCNGNHTKSTSTTTATAAIEDGNKIIMENPVIQWISNSVWGNLLSIIRNVTTTSSLGSCVVLPTAPFPTTRTREQDGSTAVKLDFNVPTAFASNIIPPPVNVVAQVHGGCLYESLSCFHQQNNSTRQEEEELQHNVSMSLTIRSPLLLMNGGGDVRTTCHGIAKDIQQCVDEFSL